MSSGQKPRTPRYFPRMKVRGARRKRMRLGWAFQRLGDVSVEIVPRMEHFRAALARLVDVTEQHSGRGNGDS